MIKTFLIGFPFLFASLSLMAQSDPLVEIRSLIDRQSYDLAIEKLLQVNNTTPSAESYRLLAKVYSDYGWAKQLNGKDGTVLMEKATETGSKAVKMFPESALAHLALGYAHHYNQRYVQARNSYKSAIALDTTYARAYFLLWSISSQPAHLKVKSPVIKKALMLDPEMADAWEKLGDLYRESGDNEQAIRHFLKALSIKPHYILHYSLGNVYLQSGNADSAGFYFEHVVQLQPDFAWGHIGLASVHLMKGTIEQAAKEINLSVNLNPATYDYYLQLLENFPQLAEYKVYQPENKAIKKSNERSESGEPEGYMEAVKLAREGAYAKAANLFQSILAVEWKKENPNYGYIISMKNWLMHCLFTLGNYADAIQVAESNFEDTRNHGLPQDMASLLATMAAIYSEWGDYQYAIRYTELSIEVLEQLELQENLALAYSNLCEIYRQAGDYSLSVLSGKEAVKRNVALDRKDLLIQNCNSLGRSFLLSGKLVRADSAIKKGFLLAEELMDHHMIAELQLTGAELLNAQGKFSEALEWFSKAKKYIEAHRHRLHPTYRRVLKIEAFIQTNLKNLPLAEKAFSEFFELTASHIRDYFPTMSETGKTMFYRSLTEDYEIYNNFAASYSDQLPKLTSSMYNNQLQVKGLLLNTNKKIRQHILSGGDKNQIAMFKSWQDKRNLLAKHYTNETSDPQSIQTLTFEIEALEVKLSQSSTLFDKQKKVKTNDWSFIKNGLNKAEAAVEMTRFRNFDFRIDKKFGDQVKYGALIITRQTRQPYLVTFENGRKMESGYFNAYTNSIKFRLLDTLSYRTYWAPLKSVLTDKSTIYFSAEGVFHKINMESLYNPATQEYLTASKSIRLITGSNELLQKDKDIQSSKRAVLLGYPDYYMDQSGKKPVKQDTIDLPEFEEQLVTLRSAFGDLSELPGTLKEIEAIEKTLLSDGWKVKKYLRNQALEEQIKSIRNPKLLHIATHGYFEKTDSLLHPLLSGGLLLAGAAANNPDVDQEGEDGILTAYEAMNLNLDKTQLVVLSACETGRGMVKNGEGVYGLQSALLFAGAKNVIMSLWKVDDKATQELMDLFYQNYIQSADPHAAFKSAQLALMDKYKDPFFWGAFVIIGV